MNRYGLIIVMLLGACIGALIIVFGSGSYAGDTSAQLGAVSVRADKHLSTWHEQRGEECYSLRSDQPAVALQGDSRVSLFHHAPAAPTYSSTRPRSCVCHAGAGAVFGLAGLVSSYGGGVGSASAAATYAGSGSANVGGGGYMATIGYSFASVGSTSATAEAVDVSYFPAGVVAVASAVEAYPMVPSSSPARMGKASSVPTINDAWTKWLETKWAGGRTDLTLEELQELYNTMRENDFQFSGTYTWEDFLSWFNYQSSQNENFKWHLPVGDGIPVLLLLSIVWIVCRYRAVVKHSDKHLI